MKKISLLLIISLTLCLQKVVFAQNSTDTVVTLKQCVDYALRNQPVVRQAAIDEQINEKNVRIGLSDWLPQLTSSGEYEHYLRAPYR